MPKPYLGALKRRFFKTGKFVNGHTSVRSSLAFPSVHRTSLKTSLVRQFPKWEVCSAAATCARELRCFCVLMSSSCSIACPPKCSLKRLESKQVTGHRTPTRFLDPNKWATIISEVRRSHFVCLLVKLNSAFNELCRRTLVAHVLHTSGQLTELPVPRIIERAVK